MILIIDNYDSFTYNLVHLIAADDNNYLVARNDSLTLNDIADINPDGILISPGPGRPEDAGITIDIITKLGSRYPILGVCLGHQAIGQSFGAKVTHAPKLMHGKTSKIKHDGKTIFQKLDQDFIATRYHSLILDSNSIPTELIVTAHSDDGIIQGIRHQELQIEGIQFHPESILTTSGPQLISNWVDLTKQRTT